MIDMLVNAVKHSGGERREGGGVEGQKRRGEQIGEEESSGGCVCVDAGSTRDRVSGASLSSVPNCQCMHFNLSPPP